MPERGGRAVSSPSPPPAPGTFSRQRRGGLQPLAPRSPQSTSSRDRGSVSSVVGRPPRLTHRSRAGCWTCRSRKVKCDETRPICVQCARLNKDCDWDHRWNFSDATSSTQIKHSNVSTFGNAVWDPQARSGSPSISPTTSHADDLPAFAVLTNDDDRERKAGSTLPGTYSVVVTPNSFSELPEYAAAAASSSVSRRLSGQMSRGTLGSPGSRMNRTSPRLDPNTVVLDRFEDASPSSAGRLNLSPFDRRGSLPETMRHMSLEMPSSARSSINPATRFASMPPDEQRLVLHFRRHVVQRLLPCAFDGLINDELVPGSTRDIYEMEAARFPPLHHAICALSALNFSYRGLATLSEAIEHYTLALSTQTPTTSPHELLSDGVFFRHYLLFMYDVCMTVEADTAGADMWAEHLTHLRRIAQNRFAHFGREPHPYVLESICYMDTYACLLGNGNCDFFRTVLEQNMLPPLGASLPSPGASGPPNFSADERGSFPAVLRLNQAVLVHTATVAQTAQHLRAEARHASRAGPVPEGLYARWQARVSGLQNELERLWAQSYPEFLERDSPLAGRDLVPRVRAVFEHAFLLYHASNLYLSTSMFPRQRLLPPSNLEYHPHPPLRPPHPPLYPVQNPTPTPDRATDHATQILTLINTLLPSTPPTTLQSRRDIPFPLFMAGYAAPTSTASHLKHRALELLKHLESGGIGQNTAVIRRILAGVCEEQERMCRAGGREEEIEWLAWMADVGVGVVNCGL